MKIKNIRKILYGLIILFLIGAIVLGFLKEWFYMGASIYSMCIAGNFSHMYKYNESWAQAVYEGFSTTIVYSFIMVFASCAEWISARFWVFFSIMILSFAVNSYIEKHCDIKKFGGGSRGSDDEPNDFISTMY